MECATCGGKVEWRGAMINLTHTECLSCGRVNNQLVEDEQQEQFYEEQPDGTVHAIEST